MSENLLTACQGLGDCFSVQEEALNLSKLTPAEAMPLYACPLIPLATIEE